MSDPDNLLEYSYEFLDALQATPAARAPRIFAAVHAVRSILTGTGDRDDNSANSEDEDMAQDANSATEEETIAESSSESGGGRTTSASASPERESPDGPAHTRGGEGQTVVHYAIANTDSDGDTPAAQADMQVVDGAAPPARVRASPGIRRLQSRSPAN